MMYQFVRLHFFDKGRKTMAGWLACVMFKALPSYILSLSGVYKEGVMERELAVTVL